jgi:NTE family protein
LSHLGLIEALENRGIRPDLVVGTSAGALFGALYCHFGNVGDVFREVELVFGSGEFREFEGKYFGERKPADGHVQFGIRHFISGLAGTLKNGMHLGKALATSAMVAEKDAESLFGRIFEGLTFPTLKIPFAAVAVDLVEGVPVVFTADRGPDGLMKAVMASCAIPFIFPAVEIGGHAHADGYIMSNLPAREARALLAGQDALLVGFDVSAPVELSADDLSTLELALKQTADRLLVDVLFQPVDRSYPWSSFAEHKAFYDLGRRYLGEERLDGLEKAYLDKCAAKIRQDKNPARKHLAAARLKRIARACGT